jgi:energy-coupling factor transporter ATP-binding protein EcfA2
MSFYQQKFIKPLRRCLMFESLFPKELLDKSFEERLRFFKNHTVTHSVFEEIFQDLLQTIQDAQPGTLVFLYGPSGVGKTTMIRLIEKALVKQTLKQLETDLEMLPVVCVAALETDAFSFDWKDFFQRLLINLNDPLPEEKLDLIPQSQIYTQNALLLEKTALVNSRKFRRAVENMLKRRKPLAVLIDEAQHIGKVTSSRKLLDQLNVVKCLADESKSVYVLSGTYELLPFLDLNDQLARRSINIQFPRYNAENEIDREHFIKTLRTFQQFLPLEQTPDLVAKWDYFYERTLGCIGTLNDWLERSFSLALRDGGKQMVPKHWEKRSPMFSQCKKKYLEIARAEKELREAEDCWSKFRGQIGLFSTKSESDKDLKKENKSAKRGRPAGKVGIRNPKRDSIKSNLAENK